MHLLLLSGRPILGEGPLAGVAPPVGFHDIASGPLYAAAVARDRILVVAEQPVAIAEGWDGAAGVAATVMDDALTILDLSGAKLDDIIAMGTTIDPLTPTRSSALLFAGVPSIAYRYGTAARLRLHVERSLAHHLAEWLRRAAETIPG
jgi:sarcosine oxidase gamma subunit